MLDSKYISRSLFLDIAIDHTISIHHFFYIPISKVGLLLLFRYCLLQQKNFLTNVEKIFQLILAFLA